MKIWSISSVKNIWKFYLLGQQSIAPSPQHVTIKIKTLINSSLKLLKKKKKKAPFYVKKQKIHFSRKKHEIIIYKNN